MSKETPGGLHEQSFNQTLADILTEQYGVWPRDRVKILAERTNLAPGNQRIDIVILEDGQKPVAVEVELSNAKSAEADAKSRLGMEIGSKAVELAIAVTAPDGARKWSGEEVADKLRHATDLQYAAYFRSLASDGAVRESDLLLRWPMDGWVKGTVADLANVSKALSVPPDLLNQLASGVGRQIHSIADEFLSERGRGTQEHLRELAQQFGFREPRRAITAASVIWLNALLMHRQLVQHRLDVPPVEHAAERFGGGDLLASELVTIWDSILKINYKSIFLPARNALTVGLPDAVLSSSLSALNRTAQEIENAQLGSMIDIGGELFPRVVMEDRDTAAAFYTNPFIAELLAHLCLPEKSSCMAGAVDWSCRSQVTALRVADFACGTGTLLRAIYRRIRNLHCQAGGKPGELHGDFMERCLTGIDISSIAVHLTATGLAAMEPECQYNDSQIGVAAIGGGGNTGSLELIEQQSLTDLLGETVQVSRGQVDENISHTISARDGTFDVVIMNPPYTRTRKGKSAFDVFGIPEADRKRCQRRRNALIRGTPGNGKAGEANSFTVLADQKLKDNGRLAMVLPMSIAAEPSWKGVRSHIEGRYNDLTVIALTNYQKQSLSADTSLSEVLLVGTKLSEKKKASGSAVFVNLFRAPSQFAESYLLSQRIVEVQRITSTSRGHIVLGDERVGNWIRLDLSGTGDVWPAVGVEEAFVGMAASELRRGMLVFPDNETKLVPFGLPMTTVENVFEVGPTHHRIGHEAGNDPIGAFELTPLVGRFDLNPSMWATKSDEQETLQAEPTHAGRIVDEDGAQEMLEAKSDLLIARSCRWQSQKVCAVSTRYPIMGGRAFTTLVAMEQYVKDAFLLWANSTLGLIIRWSHGGRQQFGRSTAAIGGLRSMPVPDFTSLSGIQRDCISRHLERLRTAVLSPCAVAHSDPVRQAIDEAVIEMLGLPADISGRLRGLTKIWCREPSVHAFHKDTLRQLPE